MKIPYFVKNTLYFILKNVGNILSIFLVKQGPFPQRGEEELSQVNEVIHLSVCLKHLKPMPLKLVRQ